MALVGQGSRHLMGSLRPGAQRADHGDRQRADPTGDERQQPEGVGVGPVQVVEPDQRHGLGVGLQPAEDRKEMVGTRICGGHACPRKPEHVLPPELVHGLREHPERDELLHGIPAGEADPHAPGGVLGGGLQGGGLAEPGLADHEQTAAPPCPGLCDEPAGGGGDGFTFQHQSLTPPSQSRTAGCPRGHV